jgi:3,4-dihydroxyphthalate decarboxylase
MSGTLGHVSARTPDGDMLVRCRGREEAGVVATAVQAVRRLGLDGRHLEDSAGYEAPKELPIHTVIYRSRPDVGAVVHAHPRSAVLCSLAGLTPQPVIGAYNIPALRMALKGVPVFPRSVLIAREELAQEMVAEMGSAEVCLLRGHGVVAVGPTVESAAVAAVNLEELTDLTVSLKLLGVAPPPVPEADLQELPDLGRHFNDELAWRALQSETFGSAGANEAQ